MQSLREVDNAELLEALESNGVTLKYVIGRFKKIAEEGAKASELEALDVLAGLVYDFKARNRMEKERLDRDIEVHDRLGLVDRAVNEHLEEATTDDDDSGS